MKLKPLGLLRRGAGQLLAASAIVLAPASAFAADAAATGIDGSFTAMLADLTGMLGGNFGALVLLISLIIAVGVYAVTSNWKFVIASVMVAFLIGYGVDIIQGIGGVTATTDFLVAKPAVELAGTTGPSLVQ